MEKKRCSKRLKGIIFKRNDNLNRVEIKDDKINDKKNDRITDVNKQIIDILRDAPYTTIPEIAQRIGKSEATANRHLKVLIEKDIIERVGSRKSGYWKFLL